MEARGPLDQYYFWLLLYATMLKETETEETIVFFETFLSLVAFQLGGPAPLGPPLAKLMLGIFSKSIERKPKWGAQAVVRSGMAPPAPPPIATALPYVIGMKYFLLFVL